MSGFRRAARRALVALCLFFAAQAATAGVLITWTGAAGNGNWSDAGNWDLGRAPITTDDVIIPSAVTQPTNHDLVGVTLHSIIIAAQPNFVITGTDMAFEAGGFLSDGTAGGVGIANNIVLNGGATFTGGSVFTGVISGTGPLALTTNNFTAMVLRGVNTYSGSTTINSSTGTAVIFNNGGSLPPSTALDVTGGATVDFSSVNATIGSLAGSGTVLINANTLTIGNDNTNTTFAGTISGTGSIIKVGGGVLTLSSSSNSWNATIVGSGTLVAMVNGAIPISSPVTVNGTLVFQAGSMIASLAGVGDVRIAGGATLAVGDSTTTTFSGAIMEFGGPASLIKQGTGTLTLAGTSSYTGVTNIASGRLDVIGSTMSGTTQVAGGSTLGGTGMLTGGVFVNGGTLAPGLPGSTGALRIGPLNMNFGTVQMRVNGTVPGVGYDQLLVVGSVSLTGATLNVTNTFIPPGNVLVLIENDGADPIAGNFSAYSEGFFGNGGGGSFQVSYVGGDGNDFTLRFASAPNAPVIGTATPSNQQATITFTPGATNGTPATNYIATCNPGAITGSNAAGSPIIVSGLSNGTAYTCSVAAQSAFGPSAASATVAVTPFTVPSAPTIGTATPANGSASITFTPGGNGGSPITSFSATCNPGAITGSGGASPVTVSGLSNGTLYTCSVRASNAAGPGAASGTVTVTPSATTSYSAPSPTGSGTIAASFTGGGATCSFTSAQFIPVTGHPSSPPGPAPAQFPHGLFDFTLGGCTPGSTITMTIVYPAPLAANSTYYKYGPLPGNPGTWYQLPATINNATVTFTLTDGGTGDDDLAANGTIVDQGGPGVPGPVGSATAIPTLSEWRLIAMALLLLATGFAMLRRR